MSPSALEASPLSFGRSFMVVVPSFAVRPVRRADMAIGQEGQRLPGEAMYTRSVSLAHIPEGRRTPPHWGRQEHVSHPVWVRCTRLSRRRRQGCPGRVLPPDRNVPCSCLPSPSPGDGWLSIPARSPPADGGFSVILGRRGAMYGLNLKGHGPRELLRIHGCRWPI